MSITTALGEILSAETIQRLQMEAETQQVSIADLVRELIEDYVELLDEEEIEDTPDEKVIADFKEAWHQAMTGQTFPIEKLFAEFGDETNEDSN
jgi:hypothetical protein